MSILSKYFFNISIVIYMLDFISMNSVELINDTQWSVKNALTTCIFFRAVTTFLQLKLILLKNLQKARCGALTQLYKSESRPF